MKIAIVGIGSIGGTLARKLVTAGHEVSVANSRGKDSVSTFAKEAGAIACDLNDVFDTGIAHHLAENPLRNRGPADIAHANKKNFCHTHSPFQVAVQPPRLLIALINPNLRLSSRPFVPKDPPALAKFAPAQLSYKIGAIPLGTRRRGHAALSPETSAITLPVPPAPKTCSLRSAS